MSARRPTADESLERRLLACDVACLVRVLRVNPVPSDPHAPRTYAEIVGEPVEFVKAALDFDDSLAIAFDPGLGFDRVRADGQARGAGLLLFFHDAGGWWKLSDYTPVAPGAWAAAVSHARAIADAVTPEGLTRRARTIVVGTARADASAGAGAAEQHVRLDVSQTLKGAPPRGPLDVWSFGTPPSGRQLWFLAEGQGGVAETIPHFAPSWRPMRPDSTRIPEVTEAEVAQVRAIVAAQAKEAPPSTPR